MSIPSSADVLRLSEERYRALFRDNPTMIVTLDAELTMLSVNPICACRLGYTIEELEGRSVLMLFPEEDHPAVLKQLRNCLQDPGQVHRWQFSKVCKDGTLLWVEETAQAVYDLSGALTLLVVCQDVTERRQVEEALRQEKNITDAVINSMPGIFYVFDDQEQLIRWNKRLEEFSGRSPEEMHALRPHDFVAEEDHGLLESKLREVLGEQCNADVELLLRDGEGKNIPFYCTGSPMYVGDKTYLVGLGVDISERKRAEEALRKSEKKFSKVFHSVPALLAISTLAEGRCIDVNETSLRTLGYQREEMIGRTALELGIWGSKADRDRVVRIVEEQGSVHDLEISFNGKNGKTFTGLFSAERIDIDGDRYMLSMVNDITERKRMEEEIARLNTDLAARAAELEVSNRELEAFNYTVAHDLRQPLNIITGYCQAVEMLCGGQLNGDCKDYLKETNDGAMRMNRLIDAMLDFSRMGHIEPRREAVDLCSVAQEVIANLKLAHPERQVDCRITDGAQANADVDLLRIVLDNLLGNAWKYTGMRSEAVIEFGAEEMNGVRTYYVRDNGAGFDMAYADKLFAPFQRLPGAEECRGFGIGLATVERIIRRHGGRIWAEGEPGKGACFYFTLAAAGASG